MIVTPTASPRTFTRIALIASALLAFATATAPAQTETASTPLDRFLAKIDLGVSGAGVFSNNTSAPNYLGQTVGLVPSNTLGPLVQLRYIHSPLLGLEVNYGFPRYTDNYTYAGHILGAQSQHAEYTLGYIAHVGTFYGLEPFAGVGGGAMEARPTKGGGQGLPTQLRGALYYTVGAETLVYGQHFGLRAQFRQLFYGAPDYNQNYLANNQRAVTSEPAAGFFLRF